MNQDPYNRRPSSRRISDLARRQERNQFNSRRDSNVRDQYSQRGSRYTTSGPIDGGGGGGGGGIAIDLSPHSKLTALSAVKILRQGTATRALFTEL